MATQTLTQIVADLDPAQRDALSGIHITLAGGRARASLSISLFGPLGFGRGTVATVNTADMPSGVTVGGAERHPDIVRPLSTDTPIDEQIRELRVSGLVGGVDAARFGPIAAYRPPGLSPYGLTVPENHTGSSAQSNDASGFRWVVKVRAGSPAERAAWATRNVRMGRPRIMEDATRWEITLPADLKAWVMAHGGAKLVRDLLEAERGTTSEAPR